MSRNNIENRKLLDSEMYCTKDEELGKKKQGLRI
jgi:hypothetical protein